MVLRDARTSFGATYVFPGGLLQAEDDTIGDRCLGMDARRACSVLSVAQGGLAYYSAAIRELFEEAGVLLAVDADGEWADSAALDAHREPLNDGSQSWKHFLVANGLTLMCDRLHYFSFWITPREVAKRFTTRFFAAVLPDGQAAEHCGTEVVDSRWLTPLQALRAAEAGDMEIPHPTTKTLEVLQHFSDVEAMLTWAREQSRQGVESVRAAVIDDGGRRCIVMPDDPRYPDYEDDE